MLVILCLHNPTNSLVSAAKITSYKNISIRINISLHQENKNHSTSLNSYESLLRNSLPQELHKI